ncbi:N-terminal acetyltransferase A complex catalytic subunit NAA10-like [Rutidosis leptorrhynchoides]|uniref:N-terminal acetyltransferase A complex catalytic subunit NAA10-like n=1 Tax=Rutidosis leptorrhynchoides TaxID=125765 RepID=UPI003A98F418
MAISRKATIDHLLAMQACNQFENHQQINYYFCHHVLSWLQFPYVAEDYGSKIAATDCHGHMTSISDLQKLELAAKFMAAAQNATEQVSS